MLSLLYGIVPRVSEEVVIVLDVADALSFKEGNKRQRKYVGRSSSWHVICNKKDHSRKE